MSLNIKVIQPQPARKPYSSQLGMGSLYGAILSVTCRAVTLALVKMLDLPLLIAVA